MRNWVICIVSYAVLPYSKSIGRQEYLAYYALLALYDSHCRCSDRLGLSVRAAIRAVEPDPGLVSHSTTRLAGLGQRGLALTGHFERLANTGLLCRDSRGRTY